MLGLASTRFKRGALLQERAEAKDHCCATGHTQMVASNRSHVSSNQVSGVKHGYWKLATRDRRRPLAVLRSSTFRRTRSRRSHRGPPSATATAAQRRFAQMVGANWAAWGSAEGEQPNPEHQCLHGGCEIRYDEVRPERRHSRQHRQILATGARLFAAQLFVARTLAATLCAASRTYRRSHDLKIRVETDDG